MVDQRFVPKSARKATGAPGLLGGLAIAGAIFGWACTDNSGTSSFVQPVRPFPTDAATDGAAGATGAAGNGGVSGAAGSAGAAGGAGAAGAGGSDTDASTDR